MKIKHRNRVSQDSKLKKKFILEKMNDALQDLTPAENFKKVKEHLSLIALEKQERQKADYKASKELTEEKKEQLDAIFDDLINETDPTKKVKLVANILDSSNSIMVLIAKFKEYSMKICPDFFEIMDIYRRNKNRNRNQAPTINTLEDQNNIVIKEYLRSI